MTPQEALARVIEHREIFHEEMLDVMRQIMSGEVTPVMIAAIVVGLRVKKETIGEIAAAAGRHHRIGELHVVQDRASPGGAADEINPHLPQRLLVQLVVLLQPLLQRQGDGELRLELALQAVALQLVAQTDPRQAEFLGGQAAGLADLTEMEP